MSKCKITRDWDRDGYLIIENAQTIKHYNELTDERNRHEFEGIFFAFDNKQFEEGYEKVKHLLAPDEKLCRFYGGGYGVRKYIDAMYEYYDNVDKRIAAECDPQEVYYYEYNNFECCIAWEGDTNAIKVILRIFGEQAARKIKRYNQALTIDQLTLKPIEIPGLVYKDNEIPDEVYFSLDDGAAYWYKHPILLNGKPYIAPQKAMWGMTADYKNGKLYNWHKN